MAKQEVWLVIRKKGSAVTGISLSDAVEEAICYGWIDGAKKIQTRQRRITEVVLRAKRNIKPGA